MARAKRTDRAEARRRYRAEHGGRRRRRGRRPTAKPHRAPRRHDAASQQASSPPGRLGIGAAFRQSFQPIDVRADLAALPWLATAQGAVDPGR